MDITFIINILLILVIAIIVVGFFRAKIKHASKSSVNVDLQRDKEKYSILTMKEYVKRQFD